MSLKLLYEKTIKVSGCYIGDACYASKCSDKEDHDEFYQQWRDGNCECDHENDNDFACVGENKALIAFTTFGDGCFPWHILPCDQKAIGLSVPCMFGGALAVDAGNLGIVNEANATDNCLHLMIHLPKAIKATMRVFETSKGNRTFVFQVVSKTANGNRQCTIRAYT